MRERWPVVLIVLLLFMAHPGRAQKPSAKPSKLPLGGDKWVENTLKKMSLEEKLGQLVVVHYYGGFLSTESEAFKSLRRLVEEKHIGGFAVQTRGTPLGIARSQVYPTAALANQLQSHAKVPLLIAADFERGTSMRLEEGTSFPHAMGVGATGEPQLAYEMGRITALEARAAGVHWIFAPVADVNSNPDNPIINTRSFGEDPQQVAEFVAAFVRGVEENGALSTAKHFPGHGDTSVDSHIDLSLVTGDRERLNRVELVPFRAAIAAGTSTIMTGHLAVPAIEPNAELPATLSPAVLTGLLRNEMGFDGIIVTDAMEMGGITSRYPPAEAAVRAIEAGADVLLVPPVVDAALAALNDAVASGRIPVARIDESVRRILRAKARLGLHKQRLVDLNALNTAFGRPEYQHQALEISDRGVTLLRDAAHLVPLDATRRRRALLLAVAGDPDPYPAEFFEREIRWRVDSLAVLRTDTQFVKPETVQLPPPESYDVAIAALFVRVMNNKGTVALPENQAALVNQLLASGKPVVVVSFGNPYLIARFPEAKTWLAVFSTVDIAQRSAGRALFGQVAIAGKIPVSVPGVAQLGDALSVAANPMTLRAAPAEMDTRLKPAYDLLEKAVVDGAFPGGVLAVGHKGELAVHAFGRHTYALDAPAVTPGTIYDVASLTKPVVTATLVTMLAASGRIQFDAPLERYLPEWATGPNPEWRKRVTLRHLMLHASGLPAYKGYWREAKNKKELLARIYAEPLVAEPGTKLEYSDLGYILLGEIVERYSGRPLDVEARERIFNPLEMSDSMFTPAKDLRKRIAPTEDDTSFRKRLVHGEVHDENAWAMGGVAGHAGLFSTARDLAVFCQMVLNAGLYAHQRVLRPSQIEQLTARQEIAGTARALGWDVPTEPSSSGRYFSARSYGHIGFSGASMWIDPEKDLFVILLTNRVHPSADNEKIRAVWPAVHDAIVEALGLVPQAGAR
jgi:beta-glucosidase-like glycosyl hydrolase/CubicO group peptidase (beta-lactamase class C family)